ncbi:MULTISPECIES: preprotein translocase subunit YajC [Dictyoglomus]|jgi:preprotein translocase subunit YajC|uniref:Sec translocon accessory complex subunit YajC n=1 Tax=Dictyoglomus turgidum (strain DSM 6724 / Z-1310) TaxID=515635 RepID=B8E2N4_DICTD|nr:MULTISPECIES: preprotein translocase subunit YajC [Dictyoglomus]ACK42878.1 preprotein translocase, YajC subunit [Dictyoglomus turgidum DSM 6724]HBU30940.1 preprotein translocase subunit YajC [Dictyoglomus sp.]
MEQAVNLISILLVWGAFLAIFYFILVIPQKREAKRRQEMLDSLKVGDRIVTKGGLIGQIVAINKQKKIIQVSFAKGIVFEMLLEGVAYPLKD